MSVLLFLADMFPSFLIVIAYISLSCISLLPFLTAAPAIQSMQKFDGVGMRPLNASEVRQIAGRAGRYRVHDGTQPAHAPVPVTAPASASSSASFSTQESPLPFGHAPKSRPQQPHRFQQSLASESTITANMQPADAAQHPQPGFSGQDSQAGGYQQAQQPWASIGNQLITGQDQGPWPDEALDTLSFDSWPDEALGASPGQPQNPSLYSSWPDGALDDCSDGPQAPFPYNPWPNEPSQEPHGVVTTLRSEDLHSLHEAMREPHEIISTATLLPR